MREATPPLPLYVFMAWCLVKRRDKFTFIIVCVGPCESKNIDQCCIKVRSCVEWNILDEY